MNALEKAKKIYDETVIPEELSERIMREIEKSIKHRKRLALMKALRRMSAAAAAVMILFTASLNMSMTFAQAAGRIPVIGMVARVLTFRSYETETKDMSISVEIPGIEAISEDFGTEAEKVNQEILDICEGYAKEAVKRAEEYKKAFLATGGTKEEWEAHDIQIRVWYEVKYQSEEYLSLAVMGSENWNSAHNEVRYYNFDLQDGNRITLEEILGSDYKEKADTEIRKQMEENMKAGAVYFEDFGGINSDTEFYISPDGDPVIVFEPYEIAPGSEGGQEFVISKDKEGKNVYTADLGEITALLGMSDDETAGLLGGGEENWTEDGSFYIGRIYNVEICGDDCRLFTSLSKDTVDAVSIWIVNGEREVTDSEAAKWEELISDLMGSSPVTHGEISEGGSKNISWRSGGLAASMHRMKDILTVSFQPARGEMK